MENTKEEFFRAVYRKTNDLDGFECVIPTVWMGNQGFELNIQYGEEGMTAQQHAEWFVSIFKKAIDQYANYQSTSQKETIEGLREMLSKARYMYMVNVDEDGPKASVLSILKFWKEAEQLLSTTEPKTK